MKKTHFLTLFTASIMMAMVACKPTEDPLSHFTDGVHVTTTDPMFVTSRTASCGAEVTVDDAGLLIELGVCWGLTENPTIDNFVSKTHQCSEPYFCLLTNLEPNTEYHVRGYAQYGTEYCYGPDITFTTLSGDDPSASPVTTLPAYDITLAGFYCEVAVEPFGITNFTVGVCFSRDPNVTVQNSEGYGWSQPLEDNIYLIYCMGYGYYDDYNDYSLTPNTQYYYRGYVSYYDDNYERRFLYGEVLSFTTPDIPFELELHTYYPYYDWYNNYIQASGYVECNKPEVIDEVGFCYSNTNEFPQYESDFFVVAGTPTGTWYSFESHLYDLSANSKYYIRSYARYMTDSIRYGNVEEVNTY